MNQSEKFDKLAGALIKFQGLVGDIPHDATNEMFGSTYASLEKILDAIKDPLEKCGLVLMQMPDTAGEKSLLRTTIIHADSEQFITANSAIVPDDTTTSAAAAAVTLQRRIAITCMLRLNTKRAPGAASVASENGPAVEGADDTRPWIEEGQFAAIKKRIEAGEKGLVQKAKDQFQMKPEVLQQLMKAEQGAKGKGQTPEMGK